MAGVAGLVAGVLVYLLLECLSKTPEPSLLRQTAGVTPLVGRHRLAWAAAAYFAVGLVVYELAYW